ncbi:MAG: class I SAM-dependent methyltransferase [Acidimicrobiia bacterium]|nr:class I SAM-dependent methyltransferase [Acidimicrobiia bacterium]
MSPESPYYRDDLALVHHLGFGFHADATAPGIIALLEPVRERDGLVLELGCGSGLLTRHLLDAGHRVIATDASAAMLDLARQTAPDAEAIRRIVLPDDPLPEADAVVSVGHVLSYLDDEDQVARALVAAADTLRPGGVLAVDLEDLRWGEVRADAPPSGRVGDDWAIVLEYEYPAPNRFARKMACFVRSDNGTWRRDDEQHWNTLIDTSAVPALLAEHGVEAEVRGSFGLERLPDGLVAVVGHKPAGRF